MIAMEPLAGWTVAVTADRRASEQIEMLERRGASVVHGPVISTLPFGPETGLRAATAELVARPPDVLVASTGIGIRSWFASSWSWGLGEPLLAALGATRILARGPKAAAAVVGEGLPVHWRAPDETLAGVLDHLGQGSLDSMRIAVQLPGRRPPGFVDTLRAAGAAVIELAVYQWVLPDRPEPAQRVVDAVIAGELDALTFTSADAVTNLLYLAGTHSDAVRAALTDGTVTAACVGPVTAAAASANGITDVLVAKPARLGAMVRALADHFAARARHLELAGVPVGVQGAQLNVDGTPVRLTQRERMLFESLIGSGGSVVSKHQLSQSVWTKGVDEHTVEVAVNRLRRKLGPAAAALETTNRRGYRLVDHSA